MDRCPLPHSLTTIKTQRALHKGILRTTFSRTTFSFRKLRSAMGGGWVSAPYPTGDASADRYQGNHRWSTTAVEPHTVVGITGVEFLF